VVVRKATPESRDATDDGADPPMGDAEVVDRAAMESRRRYPE